MRKQKKIARWLKGLCIGLVIMITIFFGGVTWFIYSKGGWTPVYFSWYVALFCYFVLIEFWKVCCEIEKDNSFSMENAKSFHYMAVGGGFVGLGYVGRIIYALLAKTGIIILIYSVALICLTIVFIIVCECLSQLIKNAYEIKQENEYTI